MRKRYKDKRAACPICKPHKRHWDKRWKIRDLDIIERSEKEIAACLHSEDELPLPRGPEAL